MILHCTQRLLDEMSISKSDLADAPESEEDWYAHLFYMVRKKYVIFTHAETLFTFIVPDLNREKIKNIADVFKNGLESTLKIEGFSIEDIPRNISTFKPVQFAKTKNRSVIGSINDLIYQYRGYIEYNYAEGMWDMTQVAKELNRMPLSYIDGFAIDRFKENIMTLNKRHTE